MEHLSGIYELYSTHTTRYIVIGFYFFRADRANNSLSENDALTILEDLLPAQNDSRFLARTLSLPEHTVQALHNENADQKERLYRVIVEFLRQAEPTPTWRAILDALRSPTVDRPRLAEEIERKRGFHTPAKESQSCT